MKQAHSRPAAEEAKAHFRIMGATLGVGIALLAAVILPAISVSAPEGARGTILPPESSTTVAVLPGETKQTSIPPGRVTGDEDDPGKAWLNALSSLEFTPFDQAAPQILKALQSKEREVRLSAVKLLVAAKDNAAILPLLAVAQSDEDAEVRRDAIEVLKNSRLTTNLTSYLLSGAGDGDEEVRTALVETAWSLSPGQRDEFIGHALNSSRPEVASAAFEMLKHESSRKTVEVLLGVYATNNGTQIERANDVMNSLVHQTFANAAEASAWWQQHQVDYQDDLSATLVDSASSP
jgi:hypothetical protein